MPPGGFHARHPIEDRETFAHCADSLTEPTHALGDPRFLQEQPCFHQWDFAEQSTSTAVRVVRVVVRSGAFAHVAELLPDFGHVDPAELREPARGRERPLEEDSRLGVGVHRARRGHPRSLRTSTLPRTAVLAGSAVR